MKFKYCCISIIFTVFTLSCTSKTVVSEFHNSEKALDTGGSLTQQFHSVLYYPEEMSLRFPGYLVGVEKIPVSVVSANPKTEIITAQVPNNDNSRKDLYGTLVDQKTMLVTHITRNTSDDNCALFSLYQSQSAGNLKLCNSNRSYAGNLYSQNWDVMNAFKKTLQDDIAERKASDSKEDDYTHILVVVMGWNTNQEEAIRNFNSIGNNIIIASEGRFNPLFIGLSWPSLWESGILDPAYKLVSYPNKANDADEVGLSWLGVLIHQTLKDLDAGKTIVIGHSFGARATSMATCVGPAITPDGEMIERNQVDLLISLQGAYSMNRFYPEKGIETPQYQYCYNANRVLLTASVNDFAMDTGWWAPFVGNETTYQTFCGNQVQDNFSCQKAAESGIHQFDNTEAHFIYVDADDLIRFNAYKSGGGAHSDIYRVQMGQFLWSSVKAFATDDAAQ